jgi:hypothetical protein
MENQKRVHKETITQVYDNRMGDQRLVTQKTTQTFLTDKEPDYVKLYITDIMKLSNIPKSCNSVLMALLNKSNYDNEIILIKAIRQEICKRLGIGDSTFRKAIDEFIDKGILTKKSKGIYIANPFLFGRGSWQDIKNIRLLVEYNEHGRFILKENIEEQTELEFPNEERPAAISGVRLSSSGKIDDKGTEIRYLS